MSTSSLVAISKDVGRQFDYLQKSGARPLYLVDAKDVSTNVEFGELSILEEESAVKVRKPYTITKQREKWTEEEHQRFLEALKLYGRGWRQIEEHIGTKSAIQIRSHAQKFFSKLEREQSTGGNLTAIAQDIDIPPPRPKRKPNHPYPRKAGVGHAPNLAATRQNCSAAASDTLLSTGLCIASGYFQTASCTPLQAYSARKEYDQMQNGEITSSDGSNSLGLKIFGQTLDPALHLSIDSTEKMPDSDVESFNEMATLEACVKAGRGILSLSDSINAMQSFDGLSTRISTRNFPRNGFQSSCASNIDQMKVLDKDALSINNVNEASDSTGKQNILHENLQDLKLARDADARTSGNQNSLGKMEKIHVNEVKSDFLTTTKSRHSDESCHQRTLSTKKMNKSQAVSSACNAGSNLGYRDILQSATRIHEMPTHQQLDRSSMMHGMHSILSIDPAAFASTITGGFDISRSSEHPIFHNPPHLAHIPELATIARSLDPFILHLMQGPAHQDSAAFMSFPSGEPKTVSSSQVPVGNCKKIAETVDGAAVATFAAASAWWALQGAMISGLQNHHAFTLNDASAAFRDVLYNYDQKQRGISPKIPTVSERDSALQNPQQVDADCHEFSLNILNQRAEFLEAESPVMARSPKMVPEETNRSSAANRCNSLQNFIPTETTRQGIPTSCTSGDHDGRKRVRESFGSRISTQDNCNGNQLENTHNRSDSSMSDCNQFPCCINTKQSYEHPLSNLCSCPHCKRPFSSFSSPEEHGPDEQQKRLKVTLEGRRHSEVGNGRDGLQRCAGRNLSLREQQDCSKENRNQYHPHSSRVQKLANVKGEGKEERNDIAEEGQVASQHVFTNSNLPQNFHTAKSNSSSVTVPDHHLHSKKTYKKNVLQTLDELPGECDYQQFRSRVAPRTSVAYLQIGRVKKGTEGLLNNCTASLMDESDVERKGLKGMNSEGGLPCTRTDLLLEIPGLVTESEEADMNPCQGARETTASTLQSVLTNDEAFYKKKCFASDSPRGSLRPCWKQTSSGLGFLPYRRPCEKLV
ncbi:hypothetical protein O6H91_05G056900 [Diphasiastrum complanatum]|uniref:Uncharacterized protein n=1 Tax=Diphasiastrum complanatum TaxID=34168 RepID=A0ACC2DNT9_DIPCM|nr:hypothetical protein O6H91_05G056900 [Diphasiastrum complanatum]